MKHNSIHCKYLPDLRVVLFTLISLTFFVSCNQKRIKTKSTEVSVAETTAAKAENKHHALSQFDKPEDEVPSENKPTVSFGNFSPNQFNHAAIAPDAHKKYLTDALIFHPIKDYGILERKTAVVGSDVCMFYPNAELSSDEDLNTLSGGIPIPIGTLLFIEGEAITNVHGKYSENYGIPAFHFQDNYNYFYQTVWQDQKGLVFGADLTGLDTDARKNAITSHLYRTRGAPSAFHPIIGHLELPVEIQKRLEKDRLVLQQVKPTEYYLNANTPDDMLALYYNTNCNHTTLFITTDLIAHCKHIVFDTTLQHLEEDVFLPKLNQLNTAFLEALKKVNTENNPSAQPETLEKAVQYFQTADALLKLRAQPVICENEYGQGETLYETPDSKTVLAKYPQPVQKEINTINSAAGFSYSPVFHFSDGSTVKEDYSQYKPRGHYTKNGALSAYFKTMMWFGRMHFLIATPGPEILPVADAAAQAPQSLTLDADSRNLVANMEAVALLITEIVHRNPALYKEWAALFDPITDIIGASDDVSFKELLPFWKSFKVQDFSTWCSKSKNLKEFMLAAHKKLKPPAISSSSVFYAPSEGTGVVSENGSSIDRKPPMGWRLFGQRFTLDSYIHGQLSSPQLYGRMSVKGLDIMAAFGSKTANRLLQPDYNTFPGMQPLIASVAKKVLEYPDTFFGNTYYGSILRDITLQAQFEQGTGFYFTESPAWNTKALLSAHGTWAELRHDTILYVKQTYAERGGGGDVDVTVRTKEIPRPVHYIEPNILFWKNTVDSIDSLFKALKPYSLLDEKHTFQLQELKLIAEKALAISILECADQTVSQNDLTWISRLPAHLARILVPDYNSDLDEDQLRMALVADVFTNAESGTVLETAVGIPYRIYVPLNDRQGGKRIAVGYCFNYYEFEQPMSNRLTNEQWKNAVYAQSKNEKSETATANNQNVSNDSGDKTFDCKNLESLKPFWAKNISLPPSE